MITASILLAAATLTNASIPPAPETFPDKVIVLECGANRQLVLTNVKPIPADCKVIKEYPAAPKK